MQLKVKNDNKWVEIPSTTEIADDIVSDKLTYSSKKIEELLDNKIDNSAVGNGLKFANGVLQLDIPKGDNNNKLELIGTYTFAEDSSTTTVWSLPSNADYLGLREVYIIVDLKSNSHGVTDIPYLVFWDGVSNSRTLMCQLCPCWEPVTTNPPSVMNRCIYNGRMMNGTMYPLYARYGNSKQYPYSINDNLSAQTYTLSRNTPYLNEIQIECNGAGIGAGTTVELWGVKYYE